jgi:branched-chain amino acid transport system permease protein
VAEREGLRKERAVFLIVQTLIQGIVVGIVYALIAAGLTLEFGILKIVNFGYGALFVLGGYVAYTFSTWLGLNFWLSVAVAGAVLFVFGMIVEKVGFSRFRGNELATLVLGVGIMLAGRAATMLVWGAQGRPINAPLVGILHFGRHSVTYQYLVAAAVSLVMIVGLVLFLKKTRYGKVMRAVSDSKERAELQGINTSRVYMVSMGIGSAIAAVSSAVVATFLVVGAEMDMRALFLGFMIIILAGMGNIPGTLVGGMIIGIVEGYSMTYLAVAWGYAIPFLILVVILLARPQGLFGKRERVG